MYTDLPGKVALITGAASGLGRAAAQAFADQGMKVVVFDLSAAAGHACAKELGREHRCVSGDVSVESDVRQAVQQTLAIHGRLDVVVNCAGVPDTFKPTLEQDVDSFRRLIDVHLVGTYLVSRAAAVPMLSQRQGSIINLSSIAGVLGLAPRNAYSAAKAGVGMLTRTLGCEWAQHGVRVNAIAPGYMMTPFLQRLIDEGKLDAGQILRRTPAGRFGTAQHIAHAMLFLASLQSEFITGATLPVDGGYMAWGAASDAWLPDAAPTHGAA
ncbi:SDR family NAD(P)-dependent oxidoreductase [Achromobacter sp. NPDC058515]|uniref:SDR family NAD(P)-dependent oxidoreductase n=1 Tax=Achromobacter sp. NPDC058515 TaxID=3346533 RepID=UPI00364A0FB5